MISDYSVIRFRVTEKYYASPEPYIPTGSIVLLIQDGKVQISKYNEPTDGNPIPSLDHPKQSWENEQLEAQLLEVIKNDYPQHILPDRDVILYCPEEIAKKVIW